MTWSARFRELLREPGVVRCPGVHDSLTARVANAVGFDAIYMTGYGTSLSTTGYPDAGLVTMSEMVQNARNVQETVDVPVLADADNGYGGVQNVVRTVREYVQAGIAGVHIEDQASPKRCGQLGGKEFVSTEEATGKIRAAVDVRDERDGDFIVIGRTDVAEIPDAIERARAYGAAGADIVYPTGAKTTAEVEAIGEEIDLPLLYTYSTESDRPFIEPSTLDDWGYDVLVFWDASTLATITATFVHMQQLQEDSVSALGAMEAQLDDFPFESLHEFAGVPEVEQWEAKYLPDAG